MHNDIDETLEHILFLSRHLSGLEIQHIIKVFLMELDVPSHMGGWSYLIESIRIFREDPSQMMTKHIYPAVARRCGKHLNSRQVERDIRGVIDSAWRNRDDTVWRRYFHRMPNGEIKRPSNSVFISRIVELLDLLEACAGAQQRKEGE